MSLDVSMATDVPAPQTLPAQPPGSTIITPPPSQLTPSQPSDTRPAVPRTNSQIIDRDDFLIHLKETLSKIHWTFYDEYDKSRVMAVGARRQDADVVGHAPTPDLKAIIPRLRKSVFEDVNLLFTGVMRTDVPVEYSREWSTARAFGGTLHTALVLGLDSPDPALRGRATTHLVVGREGTSKYLQARTVPSIKIVHPKWFWTCAERWTLMDESLFPPKFHKKEDAKDSSEKDAETDVETLGQSTSVGGMREVFPPRSLNDRKYSVCVEEEGVESVIMMMPYDNNAEERDEDQESSKSYLDYDDDEEDKSFLEDNSEDKSYLNFEDDSEIPNPFSEDSESRNSLESNGHCVTSSGRGSRKRKHIEMDGSSDSTVHSDSSESESEDELARLLSM